MGRESACDLFYRLPCVLANASAQKSNPEHNRRSGRGYLTTGFCRTVGAGGKTLARRALTVHIIASRQDAMGRTRLRGSFCLKGCPQQAHYKEQQNFNDAPLQIAPLKST
jgi:hypothetical protein